MSGCVPSGLGSPQMGQGGGERARKNRLNGIVRKGVELHKTKVLTAKSN